MWVSRKKWDALQQRLKEIEDRHAGYVDRDYFTVYKDAETLADRLGLPSLIGQWPGYRDSKHISVKEVVQDIMDRLGMKLKYRDAGEPAGVEIVVEKNEKETNKTKNTDRKA